MSKQGATKTKAETNGEVDAVKAGLLAEGDDSGLPTEDIDLEGIGTITVRGLNRQESIQVAEHNKDGLAGTEARMMTIGIVNPPVTYPEAMLIIKRRKSGVVQEITDLIAELSGLSDGARKEARQRFREDSGA